MKTRIHITYDVTKLLTSFTYTCCKEANSVTQNQLSTTEMSLFTTGNWEISTQENSYSAICPQLATLLTTAYTANIIKQLTFTLKFFATLIHETPNEPKCYCLPPTSWPKSSQQTRCSFPMSDRFPACRQCVDHAENQQDKTWFYWKGSEMDNTSSWLLSFIIQEILWQTEVQQDNLKAALYIWCRLFNRWGRRREDI